jgi:PPOX class probable F420-dependent enzyme
LANFARRRIPGRIDNDRIVRLVTVSPSGQPSPRPVRFLWDGIAFIVYTRPDDAKTRHVAGNDRVALHFNTDPVGRDVIVIIGRAVHVRDPVPPSACHGYLDTYADRLPWIGHDIDSYDATYRAALLATGWCRRRCRPEHG